MTIQTAVLIETLVDLGASVRWSSCNIFQRKIMLLQLLQKKAYQFLLGKAKQKKNIGGALNKQSKGTRIGKPNMILDDGGDLTALCIKKYKELLKSIKGVSEETTTGVLALKTMQEQKTLMIPAINVNDSVQNQNLISLWMQRKLVDGIKRATRCDDVR